MHPRQRWPGQNWVKGPKLQQKVNLRGMERFVFFREQKLQLLKT